MRAGTIAALALAVSMGCPALSQTLPQPPAQPRAEQRKAEIDGLLTALKAAPTEEAAGALEGRIKQLWLGAASPAAALLMTRGQRDLQGNAGGEAVDDFDSVLALEPDLMAAYERRAVARAEVGDYAGALRDIEQALQREPRSFVALQTLSHIAEGHGDARGALLAWRKMLDLDPKAPGGEKRLRELTRKVEGEAT